MDNLNINEKYDYMKNDENFNNDINNEFGNFVFSIVNDFYNDLLKTAGINFKDNHWTVISTIIMENNREFKVISFGLGTKSLGNKLYDCMGYRIKDCHAEIIALRSFRRFLLDLIIKFLSNIEICDYFKIFNISYDQKIILKKGVKFHLYISDFPCGDCSLYPVIFNNSKEINRIGSKTIEEVLSKTSDKMTHNNTSGLFRIKSCRSDTKIENISYSLSCSDKILLRNINGIQGKFLSSICNKIHLSSIIISANLDTNYIKENEIDKIMETGINPLKRIKEITITDKKQILVNQPKIFLITQKIFFKKENIFNFCYFWYYGKNEIGKIDPTSGLKQGSSKSDTNLIKYSLDISDYNLNVHFFIVLKAYLENSSFSNNYFNIIIKKIEKYLTETSKTLEKLTYSDLNKIFGKFKYSKKKDYLATLFGIEEFDSFKKTKIEENKY